MNDEFRRPGDGRVVRGCIDTRVGSGIGHLGTESGDGAHLAATLCLETAHLRVPGIPCVLETPEEIKLL